MLVDGDRLAVCLSMVVPVCRGMLCCAALAADVWLLGGSRVPLCVLGARFAAAACVQCADVRPGFGMRVVACPFYDYDAVGQSLRFLTAFSACGQTRRAYCAFFIVLAGLGGQCEAVDLVRRDISRGGAAPRVHGLRLSFNIPLQVRRCGGSVA